MDVMLTVTAEGRVTLGRKVLDHLGAQAGDRLEVELLPGGRLEIRTAPKADIEGFIGCLKSPLSRAPTTEEINDAIAAGWAGRR